MGEEMNVTKYTQISTKKGDKGTSRDYSNNEYPKDDIIFEILGDMDELTSMLGVTYHYSVFKEYIKEIQKRLQDINSQIATQEESRRSKLRVIKEEDIKDLESIEEHILKETTIEPVFILPGSDGSKESAYLDLSRSIVRRCERSLVRFSNINDRTDLELPKKYLNRLSDLLFIMARNRK